MSNKKDRETKELQSCIKDPRFARQFWRSVGVAIANRPAVRTPTTLDKDGNETMQRVIENYSYNKLKQDIERATHDKNVEPPEREMIMQCQMVRARYDTAAATFIRDTMGAKPVDESKVAATVSNPYEELSDEELALLAAHREEQARAVPAGTDAEDRRVPFDTLVALHTGEQTVSVDTTDTDEPSAPSPVPSATPQHPLIVDGDDNDE